MDRHWTSLFSDLDVQVQADAPLGPLTWFGIGGRADALVTPRSPAALAELVRRCRHNQVRTRVLGSGANLLVDDAGVEGVVISLAHPAFASLEVNTEGGIELMKVGAGHELMKLVTECARRGLSGIEGMTGIPAHVGGAIAMNAGGRYGEIGDAVHAVAIVRPDGELRVFARSELHFAYRHATLPEGVIAWATFSMREDNPLAVRARVQEYMAYKKSVQPMSNQAAGCMFKNPVDPASGQRVSAGRLIDEAGLKGHRVGKAFISDRHANFFTCDPGATTDDVRELVRIAQRAVHDRTGLGLETEVVFWSRRGDGS
ncbi:MAG: UDP-N-acetylenolpyruvoylglucosamine reductase MurB [Planctomycetota bacterium]